MHEESEEQLGVALGCICDRPSEDRYPNTCSPSEGILVYMRVPPFSYLVSSGGVFTADSLS